MYDFVKKLFQAAYPFIQDYTTEDIYCIEIPGNSTSTWQISPPSLTNLKNELKELSEIKLDFMYSVTRESSEQQNEVLSEQVSATRQIDVSNETKLELYDVLSGDTSKSM